MADHENPEIAMSQQKKLSDFDEIWYTNADFQLGDSHVTKYENFKNSRSLTAQF